MKRLRQEVDAIKKASDCPQVVTFYGLTFYEVKSCVISVRNANQFFTFNHKPIEMLSLKIHWKKNDSIKLISVLGWNKIGPRLSIFF